ncbi:MAG: ParB N-terminal domain-containing protein [Clostridia bacterium]|nr:ParB N-terminal domain-containing protein [Clostridia bacterium]MBQ6121883.1 ParB N-terminal domain-containing protein [Clostridia bacterium]
MKVIKIPLDKLRKPEKNVRLHSEKQIGEFIRSVNMFGQIRPIVVDDTFTMLAGNGLYEALVRMGRTEADCCVLPGLTDKQKKKLMLADNRIFNLGSDDMDVFDEIIAELGDDYDIPGYDEDLIRTLNASTGDIDAMIESYGSFDRETREAMLSNAEAQPLPMESAPDARNEGYQPIQQDSHIGHYAPVEVAGNPIPAQITTRSVACPHCGHVFALEGVM